MILIPAIDLHDGECVQLQRGLLHTASIYAHDAGEMAAHWVAQGARRIHVVDLDGAFAGETVNAKSIDAIIAAAGAVPVQLGGGIRTQEAVAYWLDRGISQVIIGTQAVEDTTFLSTVAERFPQRVILGLDARSGYVSTRGWEDTTDLTVLDLLSRCENLALFAIAFTDIERDGMLTGANIDSVREVLRQTAIPLIASGGVQGIMDLERLRDLEEDGRSLFGAISGSALYERRLDLRRGQLVLDTVLE